MSEENVNKAIVGRWFEKFWGKTCDLTIVDEIAAPDLLLKYSLWILFLAIGDEWQFRIPNERRGVRKANRNDIVPAAF
jgi:hypothetical protein